MDLQSTSYSEGYRQVASAEPSPTVVVSPASPKPEGLSFQFTKAAFIFKDKLEDVRNKKRVEVVHEGALPTTTQPKTARTPHTTENGPQGDGDEDPRVAGRLRILHLVQSTLASFLSIAIAALQGKAYLSYQNTKDTPGAWPTHPNLMPTIMLMVIAILAGALDLCLLLAYLFPSQARVLLKIATKSYNICTCVKGVSYVLVSVVCRSGFNYGNASGQNNDLWGWTCSSAADKFDSVTQAGANCDGQTAAWYISLSQIGIEGIGIFGTFFINQQKRRGNGKGSDKADLAAEFERMAAWGQGLDKTLSEMTPQVGGKGGSS